MNSSSNVRRRAQQLRRERARAQGQTNAGVLRLTVCGIIFVLLVAVKLLFPEAVSNIAQSAGRLIGRDADFKAAFAAVGRAISGEEPAAASLQDAYTAVFNPSQPDAEPKPAEEPPDTPAPPAQTQPSAPQPAVQTVLPELDGNPTVQTSLPPPPEEVLDVMTETVVEPPSEPDDTTASEALSYVYTMPALPENASLEQRNLGFAYSTPIRGVLSSSFGWREHPVEGGSKFHYGVDLAADEGEAIAAFADGTVYATGESSSLGRYIMLQHEGGYITLYAHCSKVTATGGQVSMGDKIAEVGSTGLATGPHLHFELHDGSLYLNPIFYVELG